MMGSVYSYFIGAPHEHLGNVVALDEVISISARQSGF